MAIVTITRITKGDSSDRQAHFLREQVEKTCLANNQLTDAVVRLIHQKEFDMEEGIQLRNKLALSCDTAALLMSRIVNKFGLECKEVEILANIVKNLSFMHEDITEVFSEALTEGMDDETAEAYYNMLGFEYEDDEIDEEAESCCCNDCDCGECNGFDADRCAACGADEAEESSMPDNVKEAYEAVDKLNTQFEKCFYYDARGEFDPVKAAKLVGKMETAKQRLYILMASVVQNTPDWVDFVREMMDDLDIMKESVEALIEADVTSTMDEASVSAYEDACFDEDPNDDDNDCCCEACGMDHVGVDEVLNALTTVAEQLTAAVEKLNTKIK